MTDMNAWKKIVTHVHFRLSLKQCILTIHIYNTLHLFVNSIVNDLSAKFILLEKLTFPLCLSKKEFYGMGIFYCGKGGAATASGFSSCVLLA